MRKRLRLARDEGAVVRLVLRRGWDPVEGVVGDVGKEWVALAAVADGAFAGIVAVRCKDVREVTALPARNVALPRVPELLDLWGTADLLFTAGALTPALAVSTAPGRTRVGQVERIGRSTVTLRDGEKARRITLDDVTRVALWEPITAVR